MTLTGSGKITFTVIDLKEGPHRYQMYEKRGNTANWNYDNSVWNITVEVDNNLNSIVTYQNAGTGVTRDDEAVFVNTYESTGPDDPTVPNEPDPGNPTEPDDSEDPTTPSNPDPGKPDDPAGPTGPDDPGNPENPNNPSPEIPGDPGQENPIDPSPETPTNPDPGYTENPTNPTDPSGPENQNRMIRLNRTRSFPARIRVQEMRIRTLRPRMG